MMKIKHRSDPIRQEKYKHYESKFEEEISTNCRRNLGENKANYMRP